MIETSVTNLRSFQIWQNSEDLDLAWIKERLQKPEETPQMLMGRAFHRAIERATESSAVLTADGYSFDILCDAELTLPNLREASLSKDYGGLLVKARVDGIWGKVVSELKTTENQFDAENYVESCQWRFYLDMTDADRLDWHIFQMTELKNKHVEVWGHHYMKQFRYPDLHRDCAELAREYLEMAERGFLNGPTT